MTSEARESSVTPVTFDELVDRAGEYDRNTLFNQHELESARLMVVRMFYFVDAVSTVPKYGSRLPQIGASIVTGDYDKAISQAQELYEQYYLNTHKEEPASIFDKLVPTADKYNTIPRGRRLFELKQTLRETHSPPPELLAERRMMRREDWELQLVNIERKLKNGNLNPRKEQRLTIDRNKLTDLLLHHHPRSIY